MDDFHKKNFYQFIDCDIELLTKFSKPETQPIFKEREILKNSSISYLKQIIDKCKIDNLYFDIENEKHSRNKSLINIKDKIQFVFSEFFETIPKREKSKENKIDNYVQISPINNDLKQIEFRMNENVNNNLNTNNKFCKYLNENIETTNAYVNNILSLSKDFKIGYNYLLEYKNNLDKIPWTKSNHELNTKIEELCLNLCDSDQLLKRLNSINLLNDQLKNCKWKNYLINFERKELKMENLIKNYILERNSSICYNVLRRVHIHQEIKDFRDEEFLNDFLNQLRIWKRFYNFKFFLDQQIHIHSHKQLSQCVDELIYKDSSKAPSSDNLPNQLSSLFSFNSNLKSAWKKLQFKLLANEAAYIYNQWLEKKEKKYIILNSYKNYLFKELNDAKIRLSKIIAQIHEIYEIQEIQENHDNNLKKFMFLFVIRSYFISFYTLKTKYTLFSDALNCFNMRSPNKTTYTRVKGWIMPLIYILLKLKESFKVQSNQTLEPLWEFDNSVATYNSNNNSIFMKEGIPSSSCIAYICLKWLGKNQLEWVTRSENEHSQHLSLIIQNSSLFEYTTHSSINFNSPNKLTEELYKIMNSLKLRYKSKNQCKIIFDNICKNAIKIYEKRIMNNKNHNLSLSNLPLIIHNLSNIEYPLKISQSSLDLHSKLNIIINQRKSIKSRLAQKEYDIRKNTIDLYSIKNKLFELHIEEFESYSSMAHKFHESYFQNLLLSECMNFSTQSKIEKEMNFLNNLKASSTLIQQICDYLSSIQHGIRTDSKIIRDWILNQTFQTIDLEFIHQLKKKYLIGHTSHEKISIFELRMRLINQIILAQAPIRAIFHIKMEQLFPEIDLFQILFDLIENAENFFMIINNLITDLIHNESIDLKDKSSLSTLNIDIFNSFVLPNPFITQRWILNTISLEDLKQILMPIFKKQYQKYLKYNIPLQTMKKQLKILHLHHLKHLKVTDVDQVKSGIGKASKFSKSFEDMSFYLRIQNIS